MCFRFEDVEKDDHTHNPVLGEMAMLR